jgi:hypothetical protein
MISCALFFFAVSAIIPMARTHAFQEPIMETLSSENVLAEPCMVSLIIAVVLFFLTRQLSFVTCTLPRLYIEIFLT